MTHGKTAPALLAICGVAALVVLGCASTRYKTGARVDRSYDFSRIDTYAFGMLRPKTQESENGQILQRLLKERLDARGYKEVPEGEANVLVSYDLGSYSAARVSGANTFSGRQEGGLTIRVIDPGTRETIWYGWVETVIHSRDDVEVVVGAALDALFEDTIPEAS